MELTSKSKSQLLGKKLRKKIMGLFNGKRKSLVRYPR